MKKIKLLALSLILSLFLFISIPTHANMAAPSIDDLASGISFEKNNDIRVENEILDIKIDGAIASIKATYNMKNIKDTEVSTKSMFISPNIEGEATLVLMDNEPLEYVKETYIVTESTEGKLEDWKFVVAKPGEDNEHYNKTDAITFTMTFKPKAVGKIEISYKYRLGGYPSYDFDVKYGSLKYYLSPASMWEGYGGITINLELGDDMPRLTKSSVEFKSLGNNKYTYESKTLPASELNIEVDQTGFQEFISSFKSPYLMMNIMMLLPFIIIGLLILIPIIIIIVMAIKSKRKEKELR